MSQSSLSMPETPTSKNTTSIKWKLVLIIVSISASCLILASAGLLLDNRIQFQQRLNQSLHIFAQVLAENSQAALAFNDQEAASQILAALRVNKHIIEATLWDKEGKVFAHFANGDSKPQDDDHPSSYPWFQDKVLVSAPVVHQNRVLGHLDILGDTREWTESLIRFLIVSLSIIVLVLLAATGFAIRIQRIFTQPISSLLDTMSRVSATREYSLRAQSPGNDELGRLVHGFNNMLREIELRDQSILSTKADLEHKIVELDMEISRRMDAQSSLQRREKEYRLLFEESPLPMWVVENGSLRFLAVNQAAVSHYGYSQEEFLRMTIKEITRDENEQAALRSLTLLSRISPRFPSISQHLRKDGAQIIVHVAWHKISWQGRAAYLFLINDITERERIADALRASETHMRAILDAAFDCIISMDEEGTIIEFNPASERTFGYSRDEAIGQSLAALIIPEAHRQAHIRGLSHFKETKHSRILGRRIEMIAMRRGGEIFPVELAVSAVNIDGRNYFTGYLRDITEQKHAENNLRRSEERYRSLVTASAQIVWTTDPDGNITDVLPEWQAYTGQSAEEIRGAGWLEALHPDDRQTTAGIWLRAVQSRSIYETQYRIRGRDGKYRYFSSRGVPVKNPDGSIKEWVGTCSDITARKLAEEEITKLTQNLEMRVKERTAQLEAANQELEAFSYSVSHDLRAPLRAIDGFSKSLMSDYAPLLDERGKNYLERVRNASQRMGHLIDAMLKLSRVTRTELRPSDIDLSAMVQRISDELYVIHGSRNVKMDIQTGMRIRGDAALIEIAWRNLIDNAWKFTRDRDPAMITIGAKKTQGNTTFFIQDNGAGFDMAYSDKLFGAFQRLHAITEFEGTGIGLATVHRIITKHGGHVWAQSEPDKGTTFYMTLATEGESR